MAAFPLQVQGADWSDNMLGVRYGTHFREPGIHGDVPKYVLQFQHASGERLGTHFVNIDYLKSLDDDQNEDGDGQAAELYLIYRHKLSLSALTGEQLGFGPIKDIGIKAGVDLNTKNTAFSPKKRMLVIGPTLSFDVPGLLEMSLFYRYEHNHNGITHRQVQFDNTWMLETVWNFNLPTPIPSRFNGFMVYIGTKGEDGFGNDTAPEMLLESRWVADIGQSMLGKPKTIYAGLGYQYWRNKFGNDSSVGGTKASVPQLVMELHF